MEKNFKKSKLEIGSQITDKMPQYLTDLDKDVYNLFTAINNIPKIYTQTTEPSIPDNSMALWHDTSSSKYYFIAKMSAVQKKIQLT